MQMTQWKEKGAEVIRIQQVDYTVSITIEAPVQIVHRSLVTGILRLLINELYADELTLYCRAVGITVRL